MIGYPLFPTPLVETPNADPVCLRAPRTASSADWPTPRGELFGNSRASDQISTDRIARRWRTAWTQPFYPRSILGTKKRVVAEGATQQGFTDSRSLLVFDEAGVSRGRLVHEGGWSGIDPEAEVIFGANAGFSFWNLRNGTPIAAFAPWLFFGEKLNSAVTLGDHLILSLSEVSGGGSDIEEEHWIYVIPTPDFRGATEPGEFLAAAKPNRSVSVLQHGRLHVVFVNSAIVVLLKSGIAWLNGQLENLAAYHIDSEVETLGLAGHSDGTVRVLIRRRASVELWSLEPGKLLWSLSLPEVFGDAIAPAIHSDGSCIVASTGAVAAVSSGGQLLWRQEAPGAPGALVDEHGGTLCARGNALTHYDGKGQARMVYRTDNPIAIAPVAFSGSIFVATTQELYALGT